MSKMRQSKPYTIRKIERKILVLGNDYSRLNDFLPELCNDLQEKQFTGEVIFDLLLSNGNNSTRFFTGYFDGKNIPSRTIQKLKEVEPGILTKATSYFCKHKELFPNSILTKNEVERIITTA